MASSTKKVAGIINRKIHTILTWFKGSWRTWRHLYLLITLRMRQRPPRYLRRDSSLNTRKLSYWSAYTNHAKTLRVKLKKYCRKRRQQVNLRAVWWASLSFLQLPISPIRYSSKFKKIWIEQVPWSIRRKPKLTLLTSIAFSWHWRFWPLTSRPLVFAPFRCQTSWTKHVTSVSWMLTGNA